MDIGYLGPKGTFSEQATIAFCNMNNIKNASIRCYNTIEDVFYSTCHGETDKAVAPIENSIEGIVNATMDTLIFDADLFIESQIIIPIEHNLFVVDENEKIDVIMSHPQAIAQCRKFIHKHYNDTQIMFVSSTAEAAKLVSEGQKNVAAIGNSLAAKIYGLKTLHSNIQDNKRNYTTFAIFSKKDTSEPKNGHKTSIAFTTSNQSGELHKILGIFALWNLNLTKIQSRPDKRGSGHVFFVDIEGYSNLDDVNDALKMVSRKTTFYKNLGSYMVKTCKANTCL